MKKVILGSLAAIALTFSIVNTAFADDDPPSRVARLAYIQGDVSVQPGGSDDWTWASMNRPLTSGDNVWTQRRGRVEIRVGSTAIRADQETSVSLLNVDDRSVQVGVNSGSVIVHVKYIPDGGYVEVDTPNAAITLDRPGDYRINADGTGDFTSLAVRSGEAEVAGSDDAFKVEKGTDAEISGNGRLRYDLYDLPDSDDFDRWSRTRDWRLANARSARYVSPEMTGYEDLDNNGSWTSDPTYGNVWVPSNVAADWTPYRDGHWAWIAPWGWTWVDDSQWGFVTSHYGRWAHLDAGHWVWVPPVRETGYGWPTYSPANVVFISNTPYMNPDGPVISWIPLAPGEIYYPGYHCTRTYWTRLNQPYMHDHWDHHDHDWDHDHDGHHRRWEDNWGRHDVSARAYRNTLIAGAVIAVGAEVFSSSHHVGHSTVRVDERAVLSAPITPAAAVVPVQASTLGQAPKKAGAPRPPREVIERQVIAKQAPPPKPLSFRQQQKLLEKNGGMPLDAQEQKSLQAQAPAPAPEVKTVVAPREVKPADEGRKEHGPPRHGPGRNAGPSAPEGQQAAEPAVQPATPQEDVRRQRRDEQQQRQEDRQKANEQRQQEKQDAAQQREEERQQQAAERKAEQQQQRDEEQQKAEERRQQEEQRKAEQQQQRDEEQQKVEERRQQEEQRKAEQQQQREEEQQKADEQRQQEQDQRNAEQQQRAQERQDAIQQHRQEQQDAAQQREQADEQRRQEQEELKAERDQQRQQKHSRTDADPSGETAQPNDTPPRDGQPQAAPQQDSGQPVRHHEKASNTHQHGNPAPAVPANVQTDVSKDPEAPK